MKLPEIEYAGVQDSSLALARIDQAQRQSIETVRAGLDAFGREMVRTQAQKANADLQAGLADLEAEIERTPYLTTEQVRQQLGGSLDAVDSETRKGLTRKGLDLRTGEVTDIDRNDIPMWQVAGAIYEKRARDLVKATSGAMTVGQGWQSEFEARAGEDVNARKARLVQGQFSAMLGDLRKRQGETIENYVRAGNWTAARDLVATSTAFQPAEKEQLLGQVDREEQRRPFESFALKGVKSAGDVLEAGKLIQRLESGDGLDRLEEKERTERKHELERLVAGFEREQAFAAEHAFDAADGMAQDAIVDALVKAKGRPLSFDLVPPRGVASPKMREHLFRIVEGTQKSPTGPQTDLAIYAKLNGLARSDTQAFVGHDLLQYVAAGKLSVADFRHFSDLQRTLKDEGPGSAKYSGFFGAQEEVHLELRRHGLHVAGKDAEDDALAVGYVEREANRALQAAAVAKAQKSREPLTPGEQTAIIQPLVAKLVNSKAWQAEAKGSGIDAGIATPVRDVTLRLGYEPTERNQRSVAEGYAAYREQIMAAWTRVAGDRPLSDREGVEVYGLFLGQSKQITAALAKAKKDTGPASIFDTTVRGYLRGMR